MMKLTKKIMLFEDFSASASDKQNAQASAPTTANSVAVDATAQDTAGETLRTEIVKDVDSILTRLSELSDNIKEGLNIHEAFNQYEILLEELIEEDEELNEKIIDIIKNPIKYTKIKNNLKKYQKALVQISINDVDFAKKIQKSDADSSKGTERRATLDAANTAKNKALKDQADAISARMDELAVSQGLKLIVTSGKNKAKLQAAKIVMKATSGEEAKQLKLKIETLEDRIADDGKSLKDYAKENPAEDAPKTDDNIGNGQKDAMDSNVRNSYPNEGLDGSGRTSSMVEEAEDLNEGLHPKLKKAQKAVEKGETVYGENVRFPGRFKIIELGDLFATVDYEDGTDPMEMASMNIRIDSLQFESVETEEVKTEEVENKEVEKPEVYESMSIAQRFKSLM